MKPLLFYFRRRCLNDVAYKALSPYTRGPAVRQLQQSINRRLKALGVRDPISVKVDGWFGHETIAAVKYLQCVSGLPVNGHVNVRSHQFLVVGCAGLETLSVGSTGTSVLAVKQVLSARSDISVPPGEQFCQATQQAVKAYQQAMGLRPDGIVGERTWAKVVQARLGGLPCITLVPNTYVNLSPDVCRRPTAYVVNN